MMHGGMPYGSIRGQGQGHVALKVRNSSIFKIYLSAIFNGSWQMTADSLTSEQNLNFFCLSFCVT